MSLSKNHIKRITSLVQKKYRQKHNLFIAEGIKVVSELLHASFELDTLFTTDTELFEADRTNIIKISDNELRKISQLKTPNTVLALFKIPGTGEILNKGLTVALDTVNDPGNLGTIIRLCDWFGIVDLVCSANTVDCYNTKVVQASMGSLARVNIHYVNLTDYLALSKRPVFLADMNGKNIYESSFPEDAILVMGNEANGISEEIKRIGHKRVTIPRFGTFQKAESLNVATATAVLLSEFRRETTQMQN